jgi:hypothetical protein
MTFLASLSADCVAALGVAWREASTNWVNELCSRSHCGLCLLALAAQSAAVVSLAVRAAALSPPPLALAKVWHAVRALAWPWSLPQPASPAAAATAVASAANVRRADTAGTTLSAEELSGWA